MDELLAAWSRIPAEWEPGLSTQDVRGAEEFYGFRFPPDLRSVLMERLPSGEWFPDWRNPEKVQKQMNWPCEGMRFDIEHDQFWHKLWGPRPAILEEALAIARKHYDAAPRLIPLRGHRYLPAEPHESDNPVLSVWQTDIIYYGINIADWIRCDIDKDEHINHTSAYKRIRFWSSIVELEYE